MKTMKNVLLTGLACFSFSLLMAQSRSIKGNVTDDEKNPVPFATVILKNSADSSLYKGEVTNDNGEFVFTGLMSGSFFVQVQSIGYAPLTLESVVLADSAQVIDLGTMQLFKSSKELGTVAVVAEKPFIEREADKTVVNIENSIVQAGSSIIEVMEKLPGVLVDQDGRISLRGKQGVIIMMDGKPTQLSGQDLANMLRGTPSSNIEKIEIITNPSSKWDAAGNAGIINIITKKNRMKGYNGSASVGYGQGRYPKYTAAVSLAYKNKNYNLFFNYSYSDRRSFNNLRLTRKFYENDSLKTTFETNNYIKYAYAAHVPRVGADFYLSPKTTLSVLGATVLTNGAPTASNHTDILGESNEKVSSYDFTNNTKDRFYNYQLSSQLRHKLDTAGQEITMDLDYGNYLNSTDQLFTTDYTENATGVRSTSYLVGKMAGTLSLYSAKVDYTKSLKKDMTFEAGAKSSLVQSDKNMQFYDRVNNTDHFDTARSSHFLYSENINAVYVSVNKKFKQLTLQGGLRAEQTIASGEQLLNGQKFNRDYLQVFPTLYIDYKLNAKHSVNANLGRRINRPGYDQMNPYRRLIDATTYSEGNPYLLPELAYNTELSYAFKNLLFVTASYSFTKDNITDVLVQDAATRTTNQTVLNLDEVNSYSLNVTFSKRLTDWWRTNTSVLSYFSKFKGVVNNYAINQGTPSFYVSSNNSFAVMDGLSMECNFNYNHRNLYGVTLMRTTYNLSVGVQKSLLKKKATLTANLTDVLWTAYPSGVTDFGNVNEVWNSKRDTRVLNVSFSYKFGNMDAGRMRRNTGADDEKKRIQ